MRADQIRRSPDKLRAAILHVIDLCPPDRLGAVKMHKVLYYADMVSFIDTGEPITGSEYRKRPFGPTCDAALRVVSELQREGVLSVKEVSYFGYRKKEFSLSGYQNKTNLLSEAEKDLLGKMVEFVCFDNSAKSISDFSHDMVWDMVDFGEIIPYYNALHLVPSVVSVECLDWAEAEGKEIASTGRMGAEATATMDGVLSESLRSRMVADMGRSRR